MATTNEKIVYQIEKQDIQLAYINKANRLSKKGGQKNNKKRKKERITVYSPHIGSQLKITAREGTNCKKGKIPMLSFVFGCDTNSSW